jgi:hypothetical protein
MGVYEQQATGAMRTAEIYALTLILPPIAGGQRPACAAGAASLRQSEPCRCYASNTMSL